MGDGTLKCTPRVKACDCGRGGTKLPAGDDCDAAAPEGPGIEVPGGEPLGGDGGNEAGGSCNGGASGGDTFAALNKFADAVLRPPLNMKQPLAGRAIPAPAETGGEREREREAERESERERDNDEEVEKRVFEEGTSSSSLSLSGSSTSCKSKQAVSELKEREGGETHSGSR